MVPIHSPRAAAALNALRKAFFHSSSTDLPLHPHPHPHPPPPPPPANPQNLLWRAISLQRQQVFLRSLMASTLRHFTALSIICQRGWVLRQTDRQTISQQTNRFGALDFKTDEEQEKLLANTNNNLVTKQRYAWRHYVAFCCSPPPQNSSSSICMCLSWVTWPMPLRIKILLNKNTQLFYCILIKRKNLMNFSPPPPHSILFLFNYYKQSQSQSHSPISR